MREPMCSQDRDAGAEVQGGCAMGTGGLPSAEPQLLLGAMIRLWDVGLVPGGVLGSRCTSPADSSPLTVGHPCTPPMACGTGGGAQHSPRSPLQMGHLCFSPPADVRVPKRLQSSLVQLALGTLKAAGLCIGHPALLTGPGGQQEVRLSEDPGLQSLMATLQRAQAGKSTGRAHGPWSHFTDHSFWLCSLTLHYVWTCLESPPASPSGLLPPFSRHLPIPLLPS